MHKNFFVEDFLKEDYCFVSFTFGYVDFDIDIAVAVDIFKVDSYKTETADSYFETDFLHIHNAGVNVEVIQ